MPSSPSYNSLANSSQSLDDSAGLYVSDLITFALQRIRYIDPNVTPSTSDYALGLFTLNTILDTYNTDPEFSITDDGYGFTLTAGQSSVFFGTDPAPVPTGTTVSQNRITSISRVVIATTVGGSDYHEIDIINPREAVDRGLLSGATGLPTSANFNPRYPSSQIVFSPVPDQAYSAIVFSRTQFGPYPNVTSPLALPPGFLKLLLTQLALELTDTLGAPDAVTEALKAAFTDAKQSVINLNKPTVQRAAGLLPTPGTVQDLIYGAMHEIGVTKPGEVPAAADLKYFLYRLNMIVDTFATQNTFSPYQAGLTFSLVAGTSSYQIGPGLSAPNVASVRPVRIDRARLRFTPGPGNVIATRSLKVYNREQAGDLLSAIGTIGTPYMLSGVETYPAFYVNFFPTPDQAYTVEIDYPFALPQFANLTDPVGLPPGWNKVLMLQLAIECAGTYKSEVSEATRAAWLDAQRNLRALNLKRTSVTPDPRAPGMHGGYRVDRYFVSDH